MHRINGTWIKQAESEKLLESRKHITKSKRTIIFINANSVDRRLKFQREKGRLLSPVQSVEMNFRRKVKRSDDKKPLH